MYVIEIACARAGLGVRYVGYLIPSTKFLLILFGSPSPVRANIGDLIFF